MDQQSTSRQKIAEIVILPEFQKYFEGLSKGALELCKQSSQLQYSAPLNAARSKKRTLSKII